jgi:hypothetical protein
MPIPKVMLTESQFLKRTVRCLREQEPDKHDLVREPSDIHDKPLPRNVSETNGVDKSCEEACKATEELEDSDAAGALHVGPYFDHVRYFDQHISSPASFFLKSGR